MLNSSQDPEPRKNTGESRWCQAAKGLFGGMPPSQIRNQELGIRNAARPPEEPQRHRGDTGENTENFSTGLRCNREVSAHPMGFRISDFGFAAHPPQEFRISDLPPTLPRKSPSTRSPQSARRGAFTGGAWHPDMMLSSTSCRRAWHPLADTRQIPEHLAVGSALPETVSAGQAPPSDVWHLARPYWSCRGIGEGRFMRRRRS